MECVLEFKSFPFVVPEWQRGRLAKYRAAAVACEERLGAEKRARLQLLKEKAVRIEEQRSVVPVTYAATPPVVARPTKRVSATVDTGGKSGRDYRTKEKKLATRSSNPSDRLCALARGFLTRRLLSSEKVQHLAKTVRDASAVLATMGGSTNADSALQQRLHTQLKVARQIVHEIFFELPVEERLAYIAHTRLLRHERSFRSDPDPPQQKSRGRLSAATLKSLQRRQEGGASLSGRSLGGSSLSGKREGEASMSGRSLGGAGTSRQKKVSSKKYTIPKTVNNKKKSLVA